MLVIAIFESVLGHTVRRLVWNVSKPKDLSWRVRYEVMGCVGMSHDRPRRYIGHMW